MNTTRLSNLLDSSGLNKSQLAEKCKVSRTTIDNIMSGADAKMSTVEAIASALGVRAGYLFDEAGSESDQMLADLQALRLENDTLRLSRAARVMVELELDEEELVSSGLREKVVSRLQNLQK